MVLPINQGFKEKRFLRLEKWGVQVCALYSAIIGIVNILSAVQPALQNRLLLLEPVLPLEVRHGSRIASALAGFALLLIAGSLRRRKRTAWVLTVVLLGVSLITHLSKGLDFEEAGLTLGLLILMLLLRGSFHVFSDRPSLRQGLNTLASAFEFTLVYGTAGFYLLDKHFKVSFSLMDAVRQTVVMFTSFSNPGLEPVTGFGSYFAGSLYVIGLGTLGFALLTLIRPVLVREPATAGERARAEAIVRKYGRTALAHAALFNDKSYFFEPVNSVIAYAAHERGAMALGDPIGPAETSATSIAAFREFCSQNDWTPAFASTLPDYLDAYRAAGFDATCIGYEAIIDLNGFTLEGSANKDIRNAVTRMERQGYSTAIHLPPLGKVLVRHLHDISDAWLTHQHGGEMHFSDEWFDDTAIRAGTVITVQSPSGNFTAFADLVTEYQKNELTIDLMRHYQAVENGTMEFLFARMLQWAKEKGFATFSLGLSAIVGVGEKPDDPRVEQALHTISETISRFYNFKGLHKFKEKFHPRWEPRYLNLRRGRKSAVDINYHAASSHGGQFSMEISP